MRSRRTKTRGRLSENLSRIKRRDRVLAALIHEAPDRCPMQISFTPEFARRLRQSMQLDDDHEHNPHGSGNTYKLERALSEDVLVTSVGWANSYYRQSGHDTDEWGVGWKPVAYQTPFGTGHYTEIVMHPLTDAAAIDTYRAPDPTRDQLYVEAENLLKQH